MIEDALNVNARFFEIPVAEKMELNSEDIWKAVRFGQVNVGDYSRDFLKLYAHPLEDYISYWPSFPHDYRYDLIDIYLFLVQPCEFYQVTP